MFADTMTESMDKAISETNRRREIQNRYNKEHDITPTTIQKAVRDLIRISKKVESDDKSWIKDPESMSREELEKCIKAMTKKMHMAAADLNFELAAQLRDELIELKRNLLELDGE